MGAIAAAIIVRKEKEIVATFRAANALTPASARSTSALGIHEGVAFKRLRTRAVLREGEAGTLYLDEPSWNALRMIRRRLALAMLGIVLVLGIAAYLASR